MGVIDDAHPATSALRHQLLDYLVDTETRSAGTRRKLLEALQPLRQHGRSAVHQVVLLYEPVVVLEALLSAFERIGAKVEHFWDAHRRQRLSPDVEALASLFSEDDLVLLNAQRHQIAVVTPVDEAVTRTLLLARKKWLQIETVDMDLERRATETVARFQLRDDVCLAGSGGEVLL